MSKLSKYKKYYTDNNKNIIKEENKKCYKRKYDEMLEL